MYLHFLSHLIPASTQSPVSRSVLRQLIQPKALREKHIAPARFNVSSAVNVYWANVLNTPVHFIDEQEMLETGCDRTQTVKKRKLHWWM